MRILVTGPDEHKVADICTALGERLGVRVNAIDNTTIPSESDIAGLDWSILDTNLSVILDSNSRGVLRRDSIWILIGKSEQCEAILPFVDIVIDSTGHTSEQLVDQTIGRIGETLSTRFCSANTFGEIIRVTTFGESHGAAVGAVLDGVKPGIEISADYIQTEMSRRRPGQSKVTTSRDETDQVHDLSGICEGKTTGTPIAMLIYNRDQDSSKYDAIRDLFRPGHADFTYYKKYGLRDHRGGGRSSGRETAGRVATGAVARKILKERGIRIVAHAVEIGGIRAIKRDLDAVSSNHVRCADPDAAALMEDAILKAKEQNDSVGGMAQLEIEGVPVGLGDPVFFKLDARLTYAIMTLGAVKGVEIGLGFKFVGMFGSESNDQMADGGFLSNNAGGITGGISTGQPIILRAVIKPTSSISQSQKTVDVYGNNREISVKGRHDPCIVPRIIPVIENMAALVILDAWEIQSRLRPEWEGNSS